MMFSARNDIYHVARLSSTHDNGPGTSWQSYFAQINFCRLTWLEQIIDFSNWHRVALRHISLFSFICFRYNRY